MFRLPLPDDPAAAVLVDAEIKVVFVNVIPVVVEAGMVRIVNGPDVALRLVVLVVVMFLVFVVVTELQFELELAGLGGGGTRKSKQASQQSDDQREFGDLGHAETLSVER